ncbi:phospho-N-acetylmuramoyl-pentapeptide-transferase [Candidatus Babeliales bacterium]|nr:phospho-N-acetylmuramoyl-pentapeptide-transferase [Candidatus Babeliales bacterium]
MYHISVFFKEKIHFLNVLHYVSFRAMAGLLSSVLFSFLLGNRFIRFSQKVYRSKARAWTPERHRSKDDMPTMGGLFILTTVIINVLLWANLGQARVWLFLACLVGYGVIGFYDDWSKIKQRNGMSARNKFVLQVLLAVVLIIGLILFARLSTTISFPFLKWLNPDLGWGYVPWAVFVMVAMSNAVNLTDGLDGLAIGSLISTFATFSIVGYLAGHSGMAMYLNIPFADTSEMAVIGAILVGSSIGFLWYNAYPAQIFMGDVGSLALGAGLGLIALMAKQELLLPIAGGVFVVETLSVIVQVVSFKYLGRRIFRMAPIHHHFELKGWQESKITVRFAIITLLLCLVSLMTLKMR